MGITAGLVRWVAVVSALAAGCLEADLVPCGSNRCAIGQRCLSDDRCIDEALAAACTGRAEGDACTLPDGPGACAAGVCVLSVCGNSRIDPGEVCDDGNQESGDGCTLDCRKVELCGDKIKDVGEACDDDNGNPSDGCDGDVCRTVTWSATVLSSIPNATAVGIAGPMGVAIDFAGNVFVAESNGHRVLKVAGTFLSVAAGTGDDEYAGDGGPAPSASMQTPTGVAVDGLGALYIAEQGTHRIRRVGLDNTITTIAGNGAPGAEGDGGAADRAFLNSPSGVAVDGRGNVFIADTNNHRIRKIDEAGTITTIAGTGTAGSDGEGGPATLARINRPANVAVARDGSVVFSEVGPYGDIDSNHIVRVIRPDQTIHTVVGGGTSAVPSCIGGDPKPCRFNWIASVAVDRDDQILFVDSQAFRAFRVVGGLLTVVAGSGAVGTAGDGGPAIAAGFSRPHGIAVQADGRIVISDLNDNVIRFIDPEGIIRTIAGSMVAGEVGEGGLGTSVPVRGPGAVAEDATGVRYISETERPAVRRVDVDGTIHTVAGTGRFGNDGDGGPATEARLDRVYGLALAPDTSLYLTDSGNHRIRRVTADGMINAVAGSVAGYQDGPAATARFNFPRGAVFDRDGALIIADSNNCAIRRYAPQTGLVDTVAGTGQCDSPCVEVDAADATATCLRLPLDVATDSTGRVCVTSFGSKQIRCFTIGGGITALVATTGSTDPVSLAFDSTDTLYVGVRSEGAIMRVAGSGLVLYTNPTLNAVDGDGGISENARLGIPRSIRFGAGHTLLVADEVAARARALVIAPGGTVRTWAGAVEPPVTGPLAVARLADPVAFVVDGDRELFAGGGKGVVQVRDADGIRVLAGRYNHSSATGQLARFRSSLFGSVGGVAYDPDTMTVYFTEHARASGSLPGADLVHAVVLDPTVPPDTWTISDLAPIPAAGEPSLREPTGLYFDGNEGRLYVADTGNHAIRAIDLVSHSMSTVAGTAGRIGDFGDDGPATLAGLNRPRAVQRCANGDFFIADTGNHRVRRIASDGDITTVLGSGEAASAGVGSPASQFPVHAPLGLDCDDVGNLVVTSTKTVSLVTANALGVVDGEGQVRTIYGREARFPENATRCLSGVRVVADGIIRVVDSCTNLVLELRRQVVDP